MSSLAIVGVFTAAFIGLGSRTAHEFVGQWKSWRSDLRISRDGDNYKIIVDNPTGLLGGTYVGKVRGSVIYVSGPLAPLCGEVDYSEDTDKLEFCGEEFTRVRAAVP